MCHLAFGFSGLPCFLGFGTEIWFGTGVGLEKLRRAEAEKSWDGLRGSGDKRRRSGEGMRREAMSWEELIWDEKGWEELQWAEQELRRDEMSWEEMRRGEEQGRAETGWDELRRREKTWKNMRWAEMGRDELTRSEKSWEEMRYRSPRGALITLKNIRGLMVNFKPCSIFNGQIYVHQFLSRASCTYVLAPAPLKNKNEQQKKIWFLPLRDSWASLSCHRRYRHPWHPKHFIYCVGKQVWASPAPMLINRKGGCFSWECFIASVSTFDACFWRLFLKYLFERGGDDFMVALPNYCLPPLAFLEDDHCRSQPKG